MDVAKFLDEIFLNIDGNIEVREIDRDDTKKAKRYFFNSLEKLEGYTPPTDKNVYFGVYTRRGKGGTTVNCITTGALWADFDHKTENEVNCILKLKGLPKPSILVNSGYGIHTYWILEERIGNEAVNVLRAIANRTGADTKTAEKARILRLPGTFNLKKEDPVLCKILEINDFKYTIEQFKELLKNELDYIEKVKSITGEKEDLKEFKNCGRTCIRIMAQGTTEGHRNFALCKLTKWLQLKGYNRREALDVINRWNTLNTPPKPTQQVIIEFNKVWATDYKLLGCKFKHNKDLQNQSDYFCSMGECKHAAIQEIEVTSDNSSKVDNIIFRDDVFSNIRGLELAIYFTIAKSEGITRNHLCEVVGVHRKDKILVKSIDHLAKLGLIKIIEGNKRIKEKDLLILDSLYNDGRGYTIINNLLSECFLGKRISDTEYKLLILLKSYSYTDASIYPKVVTLAEKMGKTDRTIRSTLRSLECKLYIKSKYVRKEDGSTKLYIKLLF